MAERKKEMILAEQEVKMLEEVKESKVPLWQKFKEECPKSNYYKLYVGAMINGAVVQIADQQKGLENDIQKVITQKIE
jgi:hypothetical protein